MTVKASAGISTPPKRFNRMGIARMEKETRINTGKTNTAGSIEVIVVIVIVAVLAVAGAFVLKARHTKRVVSDPAACVNHSLATGANGHCVSDLQNLLNWQLYGINGPSYMKITSQYDVTVTTAVNRLHSENKTAGSDSVTTADWHELCSRGGDAPTTWKLAAKDAGCEI